MVNTTQLQQRKDMKRKNFVVKESHFSARIKSRWRYPQGRHSKVRQMHCGRLAMPNPGFGSPVEVSGLHPLGLAMVVVHNVDDLSKVDSETQGAVMGATVGAKKKMLLLETAQKKGITVLNVKDAAKAVAGMQKEFQERKELRKKKLAEASKKTEEKKKKAEERAKKEAEQKAEHKHDHAEEGKHSEEEKQKEMAEKAIIKPQ